MGQRHSWDGDCPPLRQLGRGGRSARGVLPWGLVFRVGAGPGQAGGRLAGLVPGCVSWGRKASLLVLGRAVVRLNSDGPPS